MESYRIVLACTNNEVGETPWTLTSYICYVPGEDSQEYQDQLEEIFEEVKLGGGWKSVSLLSSEEMED